MPKKIKESVAPVELPTAPKEPSLSIIAMQVENIKRVKFARIRPNRDLIMIAGKNGTGKSSILDAIEWAITGTAKIPSQPISKGEGYARIQLQLGGTAGTFNLTRHFTRVEGSTKGNTYLTKLTLEGEDRQVFRSPQELLNGFMGKISFDPLEFIRMDDHKQFDTLRGLVTFDVDLDAIEAAEKAAYDARRDAGKEKDRASARLAAMNAPVDGLPDQQIDTAELTKKLENAANHNSQVAAMLQKQAGIRERADALVRRNDAIVQRVNSLLSEIESLKQESAANEANIEGYDAEALAMLIPAAADTAKIAEELTRAQNINNAVVRATQYRAIELEMVAAADSEAKLDEVVRSNRKARKDAIARAKMPIDGLSIGDGEVVYNEIPFSQASNAEQIRISTALAMASNPKLRVLRIKDGSLLDQDSLKTIAAMASERDYQVWIEVISADGNVSVVMEDGEASGPAVEVMPESVKGRKL